MNTRVLAFALASLTLTSNVQSAPIPREVVQFANLDPDKLTRFERALLPDIAVAVATVHDGTVISCALSSAGFLAAGTDRGAVVLWDCSGAAPKEIAKLVPETLDAVPKPLPLPKTTDDVFRFRADRIAFTPDGKKMVVSLGYTLYLWEVTTKGGRLLDSKKAGRVESLAISPDGKEVVCGSNGGLRFAIGDTKLEPQADPYPAAQSEFTFAKDGSLFASVVFNPARNGNLYGSEILFWKRDTGKATAHDLITLETSIKAVALSPDGKRLATGSLDKKVRLWDLGGKKSTVTATADAPKWIRKLAFTPDGETLVAFSSGADVILYDAAKGEQTKAWEFVARPNTDFASSYAYFTAMAVAPDGRHLAVSNGNAKVVVLRLPGKDEGKK